MLGRLASSWRFGSPKLGVAVRIIDKAAEPGTTSRALASPCRRTLELYRQNSVLILMRWQRKATPCLAFAFGSRARKKRGYHLNGWCPISHPMAFYTSFRRTSTSVC